ncbi:helix-turn-helix domain-containing protein [Aquabacterium sp. A7-Y]|uniref:GlxA family transcriptional regulator n=1 Tax=Aquabacterium sp. A7-Y TaxID=1349605 RepID=UPI00223CC446|nr:helix-turn-helix domain-containing protein [Aquabacterium sp. A7-Y]MCW7540409.1 helix-turn-helix domain-containing protein [Aquabacterium sp. A7-Y]
MQIDVLALDGVFDTGLSAVLDVFGTANELQPGELPLRVRVVGVRRRVRTDRGFVVPVEPADSGSPDVLIAPALGSKTPETLGAALDRRDVRDAVQLLAQRGATGARLAAACTGTFLLAASGALDGHKATTTWWLAPLFRRLHPQVELDESRMLVPSGAVVTAGAAFAHADLALWLLRQASPAAAALVARYLMIDARPSQGPYIIADHLAHADPLIERFEHWARGRMALGFSLSDAARAIGTSERTLARRLHRVLGKTPLSYFQDLRIERAVHRLQTSRDSVDAIAAEVGYADGVTLRTLLRRKLGRGVREIRGRGGPGAA